MYLYIVIDIIYESQSKLYYFVIDKNYYYKVVLLYKIKKDIFLVHDILSSTLSII